MAPPKESSIRWTTIASWLLGAPAGLAVLYWLFFYGHSPESSGEEAAKETETRKDTVNFPKERWEASGIALEETKAAPFVERHWRPGRLAVDESRVAHLSPVVDGIIREVRARLGQKVATGEVLAVLDCREVGQAKLELVKVRLGMEFAQGQYDRTRQSTENALLMVDAMLAGRQVPEIEQLFRDRPIGDMRQQLMGAYSKRLQAKAQYESITRPESVGAVSEATIIRSRADYETAESAYRALCEETRNQGNLQIRAVEQKLREAQTAQALARAQLLMFGYQPEEVDRMDPIREGAAVSLHAVRAPLGGSIVEQHAVTAERVRPMIQLFQIADYSKLWLTADVYETDLALVGNLAGSKVRYRLPGQPEMPGEASVFSVAGAVDPATRTVTVRGNVDNPSGRLKAGSFIEVELTRTMPDAISIPLEAVQREGTEPFVFLHEEGERFRRMPVRLGAESDGRVIVISGLASGQRVVARGGFILKSELMKELIAGE
jgi:multidrug efflux pump subunit AcrA (membrane-fusion protein)